MARFSRRLLLVLLSFILIIGFYTIYNNHQTLVLEDKVIRELQPSTMESVVLALKKELKAKEELIKQYEEDEKESTPQYIVQKPDNVQNNHRVTAHPTLSHWGNLDETKRLLKADGLDYETLVKRGLMGAEPTDPVMRSRRETIKGMMKDGWNSYVQYAWGHNELKPISKRGYSDPIIFGNSQLGATLVDAMDTLFLMEEYNEVIRCRKWVSDHFKANLLKTGRVSVFETTIRFLAGFETMYTFTGHTMYKDMAMFVGETLLPVFTSSPSVFPYPYITVGTKQPEGQFTSVASAGTLQIEWGYLTYITGNPVYHEFSSKVYKKIFETPSRIPGLWPRQYQISGGIVPKSPITLGSEGDSFYEYVLKYWLFTGKSEPAVLDVWKNTLHGIMTRLINTSRTGLSYLVNLVGSNTVINQMEHLSCFVGGLLALSSREVDYQRVAALGNGTAITDTCHRLYTITATQLNPEIVKVQPPDSTNIDIRGGKFSESVKNSDITVIERKSIQRPETIESYFYLWRITKDPKYREWAWEYVLAVEKYYKVDGGYAGLTDAMSISSPKHDIMQSFFLAETLKYLYLIFSEDTLVPLEDYVFNTEAHPIPILTKGDLAPIPYHPLIKAVTPEGQIGMP